MEKELAIKFTNWINSKECPYVHVQYELSGETTASGWVNTKTHNVYTHASQEYKEKLVNDCSITTERLFDEFCVKAKVLGNEGVNAVIAAVNEFNQPKPTIKPKIYISGKITGIESEAPGLFEKTEIALKTLGYDTVNPVTLNHNHDKSWQSFMREDVKAMLDCELIYMMSNWQDSKGAKIEREIAKYLGLTIVYEDEYVEPQNIVRLSPKTPKTTTDDVIQDVINVFGVVHQLGIAFEELGELAQAINKIQRTFTLQQIIDIKNGGKFDSVDDALVYCDLCSEVADVKIIIKQLEHIFSPEHVACSEERKLTRLRGTIEKEIEKRQTKLIDYKIENQE